jgi:glycosyltransferase involved in cell wall biosynthesis
VRILQVFKHFGYGGTPRMIELLDRQWAADGHEVLTWLPSPQRTPSSPRVRTEDVFPIARHRPDVTVVHGGLIGAADLGITPASTRSPVVEVLHRLAPARPGASAYVAVSESVAALQAVPCTVIPNGVTSGEPTRSRGATRAALGISDDAVVVGRHTRMVMEKGWHTTIRVLEQAWARDARIHALLVGADDGSVSRLLRTWAHGKPCSVCAWQENPADLLHAADIYLETSPPEAWGLAAAEAALMGLPIVGFASQQRSAILGNWFRGCPAGDTRSAADQLLELANDPAMRREIGERLQERIRTRFNPRTCARRYLVLFEELLSAGPSLWRVTHQPPTVHR